MTKTEQNRVLACRCATPVSFPAGYPVTFFVTPGNLG
jgi:hypothetical protein